MIGIPIMEGCNHDLYTLVFKRIYTKQFIKSLLVFDPLHPQDISNKIEKFLIKKNF